MYNSGPSTDPCGTLESIGCTADSWQSAAFCLWEITTPNRILSQSSQQQRSGIPEASDSQHSRKLLRGPAIPAMSSVVHLSAISTSDQTCCIAVSVEWFFRYVDRNRGRRLFTARYWCSWLATTQSATFDINDMLEMGRQLIKSEESRPGFFRRSVTIGCFCETGSRPWTSDVLTIPVMYDRSPSMNSRTRNVGTGSSKQDLTRRRHDDSPYLILHIHGRNDASNKNYNRHLPYLVVGTDTVCWTHYVGAWKLWFIASQIQTYK